MMYLLGDEVFARSHFEDAEDGQVDAKGLDVKTHLLDCDVLHIVMCSTDVFIDDAP